MDTNALPNWDAPTHALLTTVTKDSAFWFQSRAVAIDFSFVSTLGAHLFPFANAEPAHLISRFLTLWQMSGALVDELGADLEPTLRLALTGELELSFDASPQLRCWAELGQRTSKMMSFDWAHRHAHNLAVHFSRGTTKVFPLLDLLELQHGRELPPEMRSSLGVAKLRLAIVEVITLTDELIAFAETPRRAPNIVTDYAAEYGESIADAAERVMAQHNEAVMHVVYLESMLLKAAPQAKRWFTTLHYFCSGFAKWRAIGAR